MRIEMPDDPDICFSFIRSYAKINNNVYTALQNAIPLLAEYVSNTYNSNPNKDDSSSSEMNPLDGKTLTLLSPFQNSLFAYYELTPNS